MSYCTPQDVETYYLNKKFDCNSYLSQKDIQNFIYQYSAVINSALRTCYTMPITNSEDLLLLKMLNEKFVVGEVDKIIRERTDDDTFERGRNATKEANDFLGQIKNKEVLLNSSRLSSGIKFNNIGSDGNTVEKRFADSNIQPNTYFFDKEQKTIERIP